MSLKHLSISLLLILNLTFDLVAQINVSQTSGCAPLVNVTFTVNNSSYTNILWEFGDGASSVQSSAIHTYGVPGLYNVIFTANDNGNAISDSVIIEVFQNPEAGFKINSSYQGCAPYTVAFEDTSVAMGSASISERLWTFGDGNMQTVFSAGVDHTYMYTGIYDVSLQVTDNNGCQDFILVDTLIWTSNTPSATILSNFYSLNSCDTPLLVSFEAVATSSSIVADTLVYSWDFDNGVFTDSISNQIEFYYGTYLVELEVTDDYGCNKSAYMNIDIQFPHADFNLWNSTDFTVCDLAIFNNLTTANYSYWDYGDGTNGFDTVHFYNAPGVYNVQLTATSGNCTSDTIIPVTVEDIQAAFIFDTAYSCDSPFPVQFTDLSLNASHWFYEFGDGENSIQQNPLHSYLNVYTGIYDMPDSQIYVPSLIATSPHGCTDQYFSPDSIILDMPVAWFMPNVVFGYAPLTVHFSDSSYAPGNIVSWTWSFGDGASATTSFDTISHTYTQSGIYQVYLTIETDMGCGDISYPIEIIVEPTSPYCGGT